MYREYTTIMMEVAKVVTLSFFRSINTGICFGSMVTASLSCSIGSLPVALEVLRENLELSGPVHERPGLQVLLFLFASAGTWTLASQFDMQR